MDPEKGEASLDAGQALQAVGHRARGRDDRGGRERVLAPQPGEILQEGAFQLGLEGAAADGQHRRTEIIPL